MCLDIIFYSLFRMYVNSELFHLLEHNILTPNITLESYMNQIFCPRISFSLTSLSAVLLGIGKGPVHSTQTLHREPSQFPGSWTPITGTSGFSSHRRHCRFTIICFASWLDSTPEAAMVECPFALLICK